MDEYIQHLGTFEYMPSTFLGIDTSLFGDSYFEEDKEHPFILLKKAALNKDISFEDRIQAVRYMCYIPYKDNISHCIEASKSIIEDNRYDVYNRFYFFSNNNKYTKLDGHLVFELHPFFFNLALKNKYPLELTLMSARFIISQYDYLSDERNNVLEYILDVAEDVNETIYARSECADILITLGEGNEIIFGEQIIEELGNLYSQNKEKTIYTNAQNAHNETINENTRNIVRALYKEYLTKKTHDDLQKISINEATEELLNVCSEENVSVVRSFFYRISTDPFRFERLSMRDIFTLVYNKINNLQKEIREECIKRLYEEVVDCENTCTTGYFTRIVNTLNGFISDKDMCFTINPRDELRSVIFARINYKIKNLPERTKTSLIDAIDEKNYSVFEEFMDLYSPEDEIREEYKSLITEEEFTTIFNKCVNEFCGKK